MYYDRIEATSKFSKKYLIDMTKIVNKAKKNI